MGLISRVSSRTYRFYLARHILKAEQHKMANQNQKNKKAKSTIKEVVTREYTINLHKRIHKIGRKFRAPKAVKAVRAFALREMAPRTSASTPTSTSSSGPTAPPTSPRGSASGSPGRGTTTRSPSTSSTPSSAGSPSTPSRSPRPRTSSPTSKPVEQLVLEFAHQRIPKKSRTKIRPFSSVHLLSCF